MRTYDNDNSIISDTFGRECCAVNFIIAMNKMRFKQGKGDPAGFKLFLRQNYIKSSIIVRYVGNRFHVMFHQAGVLYYLQEKLLMYLENVCNSKTTLRTALIKDLKNNKILLQLRALGLIGKLVTGPWMHQLYTNQAITNLESSTFIKTCLQNLNALKESPLLALQVKTDTFGVPLSPDSDAVLKKLQTAEIEELEKKELHCMLCLLIGGIVDVIQKQLYEYYEGSLAHLDPSIARQTLSAPVHNMFAKHTLGLADYLFRKATSMKVGFLDSKVKSKLNKTLLWLCSLPLEEQHRMVTFCIKQSKKVRYAFQVHEKNIARLQEQRRKVKNQKKEDTFRRSIEKKLRCVVEMEHNLLNEFPELSPHQVSIILKVLSDTSSILGLYFEHLWYVNEKNVLHNGHVVSVKPLTKSKVPKVIVFYWKSDEDEEDGENVTMTVYGLLADYIAGDLNLSELNT